MIHLYSTFTQILFDFTVHYPTADPDGLMKKWQNIGSNIKKVLSEYYNTKNVNAGWSDNIEQVLALLKALPAKAGRNTRGQVLPFIKAVDKLIVHSEVKIISVSVSLLHIASYK